MKIKKKFGKPVKKAKCLDSAVTKCIVLKLISGERCLKNLRLAAFILILYFAFGRYDDLANLKISDLHFLVSGDLEIRVSQAKNVHNFDPQSSCIANDLNSKVNPVAIILDYLNDLKGRGYCDGLLFPSFQASKSGLKFMKKAVSYDAMLKEFRNILDVCGYDGKAYSLHSPKTGAVSHATNSGKCSIEQLKRHGRWASDNMPNYYSKLSLNSKLAVSKALSL